MNLDPLQFVVGATLALVAHATAAAEPSASDLHAARCVAALDLHTRDLAQQVKAGNEELKSLLLDRLVAGTAFVGDVYLNSDVGEQQAKALANQALEEQKRLPESELTARQTGCAAEGARLYADSNGLQQSLVRQLAQKRMNKLLGA